MPGNSYPMHWGSFVSPDELDLPDSRLNLENNYSWNNHHFTFPAKKMGRLVITQTFRDLERHQILMPKDQHNALHARFTPPQLPGLMAMMDVIGDAYNNQERLRYGSAWNPTFVDLDYPHWRQCAQELVRVA